MSSTSAQLAQSRSTSMHGPSQQLGTWKDVRQGTGAQAAPDLVVNTDMSQHSEGGFAPEQPAGQSDNDQETSMFAEKAKRRQAQNREAARKSRMRKKAYVEQLESSRLKLAQLEQELEQAKLQNLYDSSSLHSYLRHDAYVNPGISALEMEYSLWLEEQYRQNCQLRVALKANVSDAELQKLVEASMNHYHYLFRMKADATKADVFYLMSGAWRPVAERLFIWIGGFRPSDLFKVVTPRLEPLTEAQQASIKKLCHSSQLAEDILSQGLERLEQGLGQIVLVDEMYDPFMTTAIESLAAIDGFVSQADHLREQTLHLMLKILTTHQAARGLLALGDYFHHLSAISALWAAQSHHFHWTLHLP